MIVFCNNEIETGAYAESFIEDWFEERVSKKQIIKSLLGGFSFNKNFEETILEEVKKYE